MSEPRFCVGKINEVFDRASSSTTPLSAYTIVDLLIARDTEIERLKVGVKTAYERGRARGRDDGKQDTLRALFE